MNMPASGAPFGEDDMFEDLTVDTKDLAIKLQPAVRALFEPVSGVMVMNVADPEFAAMRQNPEDPLAEEFAHEMYHCIQVYTTGYQFNRTCLLRDALFEGFSGNHMYRKLGRYVVDK